MLLGPLQSCTFLLNQGLLAATLGAFWSAQAHWAISVPAAALVRVTGTLAYIVLSSWTMNENLFALLLSNVYALLVSNTSSACLLSCLRAEGFTLRQLKPLIWKWCILFPGCMEDLLVIHAGAGPPLV